MDKLIVIDYQEGAGGEFIARLISAHFGHELNFDQQQHPNHIQKWMNSHSIVEPDWDQRFPIYFRMFLDLCQTQGINQLAIPYHLYKWPRHVDLILEKLPNTRFVKINCEHYLPQVHADFQRKILDRPLVNFGELQFLLKNKPKDFIKSRLELYKHKDLTYRNLFPPTPLQLQQLPSNDIDLDYGDFFSNFDQTAQAYENLCSALGLTPDVMLLSLLLERNKKNYQDLLKHLSKA